ncbi:MAG: hypothetical protein N3A69_09275 [Leptospiraceae bacterium]|nr:hypothetical protein [Leptospiraceae bacterium]
MQSLIMLILANPIYDTVFKFLMEDLDIAKEIISVIIDKEILEISVHPQENTFTTEKKGSLTVYRLDFLALIQTNEGKHKVLIELQKAMFSSDIERFRKYLGEQYKKDEYPIITIYFLGHEIDKDLPAIISIERTYKNRVTGEIIQKKNQFIECLTHDSYVIQIPLLKPNYQTKIERILSVFNQENLSEDKKVIYYNLEVKDAVLQKITQRLMYGAADEKLKKQMELEEEVLRELENLERKVEQKEQFIQEQKQIIQEKEQMIQEKDRQIAEMARLIEQLKRENKE